MRSWRKWLPCSGRCGASCGMTARFGSTLGTAILARKWRERSPTRWRKPQTLAAQDAGSSEPRGPSRSRRLRPDRLKPKDLIGIPWRVAFALQADGWYLRQDIIWSKPNPMPESVTDRCTKAHEYIFLLSKSARYHYDAKAIAEAAIRGSFGAARPGNMTAKYDGRIKTGASTKGRRLASMGQAPATSAAFGKSPRSHLAKPISPPSRPR
jgi:hypothetical protein